MNINEKERLQIYELRKQVIKTKVIGKHFFEESRKMGNKLAVDALRNSESLNWNDLERKLILSLSYYDKTPGLDLIYQRTLLNSQLNTSETTVIEMNDYQMVYLKKNYLETVFANLNYEDRTPISIQVQAYFDEIYRVAKNRSVCLRALIQNMYLQINKNLQQLRRKHNTVKQDQIEKVIDREFTKIVFFISQFIQNQSHLLSFLLDKTLVTALNSSLAASYSSAKPYQHFGSSGETPPGFKRNILKPLEQISERQLSSPESVEILDHFENFFHDYVTKNRSPARKAQCVEICTNQRLIEAISSIEFLFQDDFLPNLLKSRSNCQEKLRHLLNLREIIDSRNFVFKAKINWVLANQCYKSSLSQQQEKQIETSIDLVCQADAYLQNSSEECNFIGILNKYIKQLVKKGEVKAEQVQEINCPTKRQIQLFKAMLEGHKRQLKILYGHKFKHQTQKLESFQVDDGSISKGSLSGELSNRDRLRFWNQNQISLDNSQGSNHSPSNSLRNFNPNKKPNRPVSAQIPIYQVKGKQRSVRANQSLSQFENDQKSSNRLQGINSSRSMHLAYQQRTHSVQTQDLMHQKKNSGITKSASESVRRLAEQLQTQQNNFSQKGRINSIQVPKLNIMGRASAQNNLMAPLKSASVNQDRDNSPKPIGPFNTHSLTRLQNHMTSKPVSVDDSVVSEPIDHEEQKAVRYRNLFRKGQKEQTKQATQPKQQTKINSQGRQVKKKAKNITKITVQKNMALQPVTNFNTFDARTQQRFQERNQSLQSANAIQKYISNQVVMPKTSLKNLQYETYNRPVSSNAKKLTSLRSMQSQRQIKRSQEVRSALQKQRIGDPKTSSQNSSRLQLNNQKKIATKRIKAQKQASKVVATLRLRDRSLDAQKQLRALKKQNNTLQQNSLGQDRSSSTKLSKKLLFQKTPRKNSNEEQKISQVRDMRKIVDQKHISQERVSKKQDHIKKLKKLNYTEVSKQFDKQDENPQIMIDISKQADPKQMIGSKKSYDVPEPPVRESLKKPMTQAPKELSPKVVRSRQYSPPQQDVYPIQDGTGSSNDKRFKIKSTVTEANFLPLKKLGGGSFGDVFLVREHSSGKLFAMKTLSKSNNLEDSWLRYVKTERDVLAYSDNPFIVKLRHAFQTKKKLFLVLDFCPGGDLEYLLSQQGGPLTEAQARFYIAEIIIAMRDLHSRNIIYRDLKPDNVVIGNDGHIQLIDFGMAKSEISEVQRGAKTFCGSVMYLAPEMLKKVGHGQALDWYLLGVLLYEMLVGQTPYFATNKDQLFNNILYGKLKLPKNISSEVRSLLIALLSRNPTKRLGSTPGEQGAEEIMRHPFFSGIDWDKLYNREYFNTVGFWPEKPEHSVSQYERETKHIQMSPDEIKKIYQGENTDEEIQNEMREYEDDGEDSESDQNQMKSRSDADIHKARSKELMDPNYLEKLKAAKKEVARKAKQYYVHIDEWDFSRDEHMRSIVRAETEVQIEEKNYRKSKYREYEEEKQEFQAVEQPQTRSQVKSVRDRTEQEIKQIEERAERSARRRNAPIVQKAALPRDQDREEVSDQSYVSEKSQTEEENDKPNRTPIFMDERSPHTFGRSPQSSAQIATRQKLAFSTSYESPDKEPIGTRSQSQAFRTAGLTKIGVTERTENQNSVERSQGRHKNDGGTGGRL